MFIGQLSFVICGRLTFLMTFVTRPYYYGYYYGTLRRGGW
jgi:hypothetical protein